MKWWFSRKLHIQIAIGIVIGIALGVIMGENATVLNPIGQIFLRLLQMLIVPLVFFSITSGVTKMGDLKSLRSVGGRILLYYTVTSLLATVVGIIFALIIQPGKEVVGLLSEGGAVEVTDFNFIENLVSWVPTNIVDAMVNANMLQIIFFSIILGVTLLALGEKVKAFTTLIEQGTDIMLKITELVMKVAPYGIIALMAELVGTLGAQMLSEVARFIVTDYVALILLLLIVYPIALKVFAKINPMKFYKSISPTMLVAASTSSSAATLPVSMNLANKTLKIPERIYGFTLPLGSTVNMDGMAVALGVISVFAANIYDLPITFGFLFQFALLGLVLSIGAAGVRGAGIVMSTVLLQTLNLPLDLVPILAAIWPIIDIGHTTLNCTGDLAGTSIVAASMGEMDVEEFNNSEVEDAK